MGLPFLRIGARRSGRASPARTEGWWVGLVSQHVPSHLWSLPSLYAAAARATDASADGSGERPAPSNPARINL